MLPVAPARPLWWLARWAARLLTGLAVAAAFTLGAWDLPGHPAIDRLTATVPPVETSVPPASAGWHQAAPLDVVGLVMPTAQGADDPADQAEVSAMQPAASGRPGLTALGSVAAGGPRWTAAQVGGVRAARAPPRA